MEEITSGLSSIWSALAGCFNDFLWQIPVIKVFIVITVAGAVIGLVVGGIFAFKK